jgi:hypothetical protein
MPMRIWRIVPGESDYRSFILGDNIRRDYISVGWNEMDDLSKIPEE